MAFQDVLNDLRELDLNELSVDNIGSWPTAVKVIAAALLFILVMALGYFYNISDMRD